MTKVLLVWSDVPERERIFLLDFDNEEDYQMCLRCHGQLLNTCVDPDIAEALNEIRQLVERTEPIYDSEKSQPPRSIDRECTIVVSGIIL